MTESQNEAKNEKTNKLLKTLENIAFTVFMAIMLSLIFITAQSRITGKEPSLLGHRIYVVESGSMEPAIKINSMIFVNEMDWTQVKVGDMITYYGNSKKTRVTHRVIDINKEDNTFITKGDANNVEDPLALKGENIIGKVVFQIPYIGLVLRILGTKLAVFLVIVLGGAWIILPKLLSKTRN